MPRRSRPRRSSVPRTGRTGSCLAIVRIDPSKARKKIRADYEKAQRALARARAQIDHFNQKDLPLFQRWFYATFGPRLSELRALLREVQYKAQLLQEIEREVVFHNVSYRTAYRRAQARHQSPPPPEDDDPDARKEDERSDSRRRPHSGDPWFESDGEGAGADPFEDHYAGRDTGRPGHAKPRPSPTLAARLKELYRSLVRRLHPDKRTTLTDQEREWWHRTQEAYNQRNVEELEIILALCEIDDLGSTDRTSLSTLQRITAQYRAALRDVNRQLRILRQDSAWGFATRSTRNALESKLSRELETQLAELRHQLRDYDRFLSDCRKARPRRTAHPAASWLDEFLWE